MKRKKSSDYNANNLFGEPQNLKSLEIMKNYLKQIDIEKLKYMLKEIEK